MPGHRIRFRRGPAAIAAVATALVLGATGLSACGSSGGSGATSGSATAGGSVAPSAPAGPSTPASTGGPSAPATGTGGGDVAAIKAAFTTFFAPGTPEQESLDHLQNGAAFKQVIEQQAKNPMASTSSVEVSNVSVLKPDLAQVTFTILVSKQPLLSGQTGYAVKEGGTWKVSEYTFCGLLKLEGNPPAECSSPTATTTPS